MSIPKLRILASDGDSEATKRMHYFADLLYRDVATIMEEEGDAKQQGDPSLLAHALIAVAAYIVKEHPDCPAKDVLKRHLVAYLDGALNNTTIPNPLEKN